jgi:hypothetical protein
MHKLLLTALLGGICLVSLPQGRADDSEAKTVIDKAIKAHGGEDVLVKVLQARIKSKGTMVLMGMNVAFTSDLICQLPKKSKQTFTLQAGDQKITMVQVVSGSKAWVVAGGETKDIEGDELKALREDNFANHVESLVPLLKDKDFTLSSIAEAKVNGKPAAGVKVKAKDHKDVDLYFDKETGFLVRVVRDAYNPETMKEAVSEIVYSDFKDFSGVKQPVKARLSRDGKKFADVEVTNLQLLDKVNPNEFTKSF